MANARVWLIVFTGGVVACGSAPPGEDYSSSGNEVISCAAGATTEGIDVSKWDGTIDWAAVKQSGKAFAFIRVSDGLGYPDQEFAANWAGARAAGVYRGVYQYFEASQDPTAQANLLVSALKGDRGELPAVVDVEVTDGQTPATIRSKLDVWSAVVQKATGRVPIVYTSPGFWPSVGGPPESDQLWVANWGVSCPSLPSAWSSWKFWQYSDTGKVAGIAGQVDLNRFDGSPAELAAYVHATAGGGDAGAPGDGGADAGSDGHAGSDAASDAGADGGHPGTDSGTSADAGKDSSPPAPTWTEIYQSYLTACQQCHSGTGSATGLYSFLKGYGYVGGANPKLTSPGSCLTWYGGNMPPGGPSGDPPAVAAMNAWAAAGGLDD